jgi:hypothetical protein
MAPGLWLIEVAGVMRVWHRALRLSGKPGRSRQPFISVSFHASHRILRLVQLKRTMSTPTGCEDQRLLSTSPRWQLSHYNITTVELKLSKAATREHSQGYFFYINEWEVSGCG